MHEEAVAQLRTAADREAARWAAGDVTRVAVDDAVAVTPGTASRVVTPVRELIETGTPWRADAFAVLIYVLTTPTCTATCAPPLAPTAAGGPPASPRSKPSKDALAGLDRAVRNVLDDPDPETRSLATLLLSRIATEPAADRNRLALLNDTDPEPLWRWPAEEL